MFDYFGHIMIIIIIEYCFDVRKKHIRYNLTLLLLNVYGRNS